MYLGVPGFPGGTGAVAIYFSLFWGSFDSVDGVPDSGLEVEGEPLRVAL